MATEESDPMLGSLEVSKTLGVSERTLREWVRTGEIVAPYRIGRTPKWRSSELNAWVQARKESQ